MPNQDATIPAARSIFGSGEARKAKGTAGASLAGSRNGAGSERKVAGQAGGAFANEIQLRRRLDYGRHGRRSAIIARHKPLRELKTQAIFREAIPAGMTLKPADW